MIEEFLLSVQLAAERKKKNKYFKKSRSQINPFHYDHSLVQSPIERELGQLLDIYLNKTNSIILQQPIIGKKRPDFLISDGNRNIIIECDGNEYHSPNMDIDRDNSILNSDKDIHAIYRFDGSFIYNHPDIVLSIIAIENLSLFRKDANFYRGLIERSLNERYGSICEIEKQKAVGPMDYNKISLTIIEVPLAAIDFANMTYDNLTCDFYCDCHSEECCCFERELMKRLSGVLIEKKYHYRKLIS